MDTTIVTITRSELEAFAAAGQIRLAHTHTKGGKPVTHTLITTGSVIETACIPAGLNYLRAGLNGQRSVQRAGGFAPLATSSFTLADGRIVKVA